MQSHSSKMMGARRKYCCPTRCSTIYVHSGYAERMSETVLITGGTGFIGRHLCADLLADGWQVDVLTRDIEKVRRALPDDVHAVSDPSASRTPAAIVNLAGENLASGRWTAARKRELCDSRMRVTRNVIDYIANAELRPRVLVSGSAVGYYGARGEEPLGEDTAPGDEFQSQLVSDWEHAAMAAADYVRVCYIRTGWFWAAAAVRWRRC